jgi:hypothetical protein
MKAPRFILCILILSSCCGCFVPKPRDNDPDACKLVTKQYTLDFSAETGGAIIAQSIKVCPDPTCILVAPLVMAAALPTCSFVVSGSIVVVGNTIHWIEGQGRCDDSATNKAIERLKSSTKKFGGVVINTKDDAINWLKTLDPTRRE